MTGSKNPPGLFAAIVCRPELWRNITERAEDRARVKLRELEGRGRGPAGFDRNLDQSLTRLITSVSAKSALPQTGRDRVGNGPVRVSEPQLVEAA